MKYALLVILTVTSLSAYAKNCSFKPSEDILDFAIKMMKKKGCVLDESSPLELVFDKEVIAMKTASHFGAICPFIEISTFHYSLIDRVTGSVVARGSEHNASDVKYNFDYDNGEAKPKELIYCGWESFLNPTIRKAIKRLVKDYHRN